MSTHNICFCGEIRKIFTGYPPLSRPMQVMRYFGAIQNTPCNLYSHRFVTCYDKILEGYSASGLSSELVTNRILYKVPVKMKILIIIYLFSKRILFVGTLLVGLSVVILMYVLHMCSLKK